METGGFEYYLFYKRGQHELRKIINSDDDYEVVFSGHYEACIKHYQKIRNKNFEYDYNL